MMTEEEKDELTEILKKFLSTATHYYKMKQNYYSNMEVGELEFFEILRKLDLIRVPDDLTVEEYFKIIFNNFSITKNSTPRELKDFKLNLFGFPAPFHKVDNIEQVSMVSFFKVYNFKLKELETLDKKGAKTISDQFVNKIFNLGFLYLKTLRHPTEENIIYLIKHYKYRTKAKARTKIYEFAEKYKKIA